MQSCQRIGLQCSRRLRPQLQRQWQRKASDSHGSPGSHDSHAQPAYESFGARFYIVLALIPATFAVVKFTNGGQEGYLTRLITDKYKEYTTQWTERSKLHTDAVERAAADRLLFLNESGQGPRRVELRFPEQFNTGSPWNVPAGHGHANIDEVIAKYQQQNREMDEKKLQRLRNNAGSSERSSGSDPIQTAKETAQGAYESAKDTVQETYKSVKT